MIALAIAGLIRGRRDGSHFIVTSKRSRQILKALGVPKHTTCGRRNCAEHRAEESTRTAEARKVRAESKAEIDDLNGRLFHAWSMPYTHVQELHARATDVQKKARKLRPLASDRKAAKK